MKEFIVRTCNNDVRTTSFANEKQSLSRGSVAHTSTENQQVKHPPIRGTREPN